MLESEKCGFKEVDAMLTSAKSLIQEDFLVVEMKKYIQELMAQGEKRPGQAKKEAIEALRRTGVLTEDGEEKEKIVSWE